LTRALAAAAAATLALAGCGGDDDDEKRPAAGDGTDTAARTTDTSRDATPPTETEPERIETEREDRGPEDQPGGAGDELPARTQAQFSGRGGRISPRVVLVPPFISVRVELRSVDGRAYAVRLAGRRLSARGGAASASASLPGLRPGRAYVGRGSDGGRVRIEASAEPGP
jgi:hypothetical protein